MALARPLLLAVLLALGLAALGTQAIAFTDYEVEAEAAAVALAAGELSRFAELAPAYGGSLVLRAPFAWAASALGFGDDLALYRALVLPALALVVALGVVLWRGLRPVSAPGAWLALCLAVAGPFGLRALEVGHPEELVGGVLCVAAVLVALRDRPLLAGLLLGLAGANKPWALLAVLPVLYALRTGHLRCTVVAGAVCAAALAPLGLGGTLVASTSSVVENANAIFQPWQLFWFLGEHGAPVSGLNGEKEGFRTVVPWAQRLSHPLLVALGLGLALAWWPRRRREGVLALLALVLLTRCLLDTWNTDYYAVPFLLALLAHESVIRRRVPWGTLTTTTGLWVAFVLLPTPDVQAAAYLLVAGTAWAALALATFAPARAAALTWALRGRAARGLPNLLPQPVSSPTAARRSPGLTAQP